MEASALTSLVLVTFLWPFGPARVLVRETPKDCLGNCGTGFGPPRVLTQWMSQLRSSLLQTTWILIFNSFWRILVLELEHQVAIARHYGSLRKFMRLT